MTTVLAELKNLRVSPRKVRLITEGLRGRRALEAVSALRFTEKKAALPVSKVIKSALSNATNNNKLDEKKLFIVEIQVMEGTTLKRSRPRSRGMAHRINKRTSHIRVVLEGRK